MNPTNQRILLAMIAGYRGGRDLRSTFTDPNFSSLSFEDKSEIIKAFASVVGNAVVPKLSALGYTKELAGGALQGAMSTLPLSAILHTVAMGVYKDGLKNTLDVSGKVLGNNGIRTFFGPIAAIGAAAGMYGAGRNIYNQVKHKNALTAGLQSINTAASPEESDQAVANLLFSRILHSAPAQSTLLHSITPVVRDFGRTISTAIDKTYASTSGVSSAEKFDEIDAPADITAILSSNEDNAVKAEKINALAGRVATLRKNMLNALPAMESLNEQGFNSDEDFNFLRPELVNRLHKSDEILAHIGNMKLDGE